MSVKHNKLVFTLFASTALLLAVCATVWITIRNLGAIIGSFGIESSLPLSEILNQLQTAQIQLPVITTLLISFAGCSILSFMKKHTRTCLTILLYLPLFVITLGLTKVNSIYFVDAVKTILLVLGI